MADKKTKPQRSTKPGAGPLTADRPSRRATTSGTAKPVAGAGKPQPGGQKPKQDIWKLIKENFGWGLIIGMPIIIVIVALLYRATDGFTSKPSPTEAPLPTVAATPTAGAFVAPPQTGANLQRNRILYLSTPDSKNGQQIFSAEPDGSNPVQLTNTPEIKANPAWSPDGKQIAFTAGSAGVQLLNFDGSGLHTVAYGGFSPVWSPDGKQLAFLKAETAKDGKGPNGDGSVRILYITKAEAKPGDEKPIAYDALAPVWSPDGKEIMYFSLRNLVIFTVEAKDGGTPAIQFNVPNSVAAWFPVYTADGKSIVFYGSPNANYLAGSLDQNATFLTPTVAVSPTVTPTTTAAATGTPVPTATSTPSPTPLPNQISNLYFINRDGSGLKILGPIEDQLTVNTGSLLAAYINNGADGVGFLTSRPFYRMYPVISADGKQVAAPFITKDNTGIQIVALAGSNTPLKIIGGEGNLEAGIRLNPTFSADGNKVIYLFQPPQKDKPIEVRAYDLTTKTEAPFAKDNTYGFPSCCGFRK
jgi:Tol biopolymer transport system component